MCEEHKKSVTLLFMAHIKGQKSYYILSYRAPFKEMLSFTVFYYLKMSMITDKNNV